MITRRHFLSLLAAASLAPGASAQSRDKVWRLGYLAQPLFTDPPSPERAAFIAALRELGYTAGTNLVIARSAAGAQQAAKVARIGYLGTNRAGASTPSLP